MKKFKGLMAFIMLVSIMLVGSVMAIPTISVTIQKAAMGEGTITAPVSNANINLIPTSDGLKLDKVSVSFDQNLDAGSVIYVYAYDDNGTLLDSQSLQLNTQLTAGSATTIDFPNDPSMEQVASIKVIVLGPQV